MELAIVTKNKTTSAPDPEAIIGRVNGGTSEARYQKDQIVYSQGDPADSVFYVQSGRLKVTAVSEEGKEAVVAIVNPGCGPGANHHQQIDCRSSF